MKIAKSVFLTISSIGLCALVMSFSGSTIAQNDSPGRSTVNVRAISTRIQNDQCDEPQFRFFSEDLPRVSRQGVTDGRGDYSL